MHKIGSQLFIILSVFLIGIISVAACFLDRRPAQHQNDNRATASQSDLRLQILIPDAPWVPAFFKFLDEQTKKANLPSLKTIILPNKDDLEIRYWVGTIPHFIDGIILRRINNQWSGIHIHGSSEHQDFLLTQKALIMARSGWDEVWKELVKTGILTLPDATSLNCNESVIDGTVFVVEINHNWTYRTYAYGNPQHAKCSEAKRMLSMAQILYDEFDLYAPSLQDKKRH